jgi:hypothetical protein
MARECLSGAYGPVTDVQNLIAILGVPRAAVHAIEAQQAIPRRGFTGLFAMALLKSPISGKPGHNWGHREIR